MKTKTIAEMLKTKPMNKSIIIDTVSNQPINFNLQGLSFVASISICSTNYDNYFLHKAGSELRRPNPLGWVGGGGKLHVPKILLACQSKKFCCQCPPQTVERIPWEEFESCFHF